MDIEKLIKEITSNEDALAFTKSKGANIHEARAVTEQTMHDVFYVPSAYENSGIYIKIGKKRKKKRHKKKKKREKGGERILEEKYKLTLLCCCAFPSPDSFFFFFFFFFSGFFFSFFLRFL